MTEAKSRSKCGCQGGVAVADKTGVCIRDRLFIALAGAGVTCSPTPGFVLAPEEADRLALASRIRTRSELLIFCNLACAVPPGPDVSIFVSAETCRFGDFVVSGNPV